MQIKIKHTQINVVKKEFHVNQPVTNIGITRFCASSFQVIKEACAPVAAIACTRTVFKKLVNITKGTMGALTCSRCVRGSGISVHVRTRREKKLESI